MLLLLCEVYLCVIVVVVRVVWCDVQKVQDPLQTYLQLSLSTYLI